MRRDRRRGREEIKRRRGERRGAVDNIMSSENIREGTLGTFSNFHGTQSTLGNAFIKIDERGPLQTESM